MDVVIPDIGDAEDVEVIEICVAAGDAVAANDALIVIESDKASMEVPAPFGGTVDAVLVALGDVVNAGDAILRIAQAASVEPLDEHAASDGVSDVVETEPESAVPPASAGGLDRVEIRLPDMGEAEGVAVIEVAVQAGQAVAIDDVLVVVESEKASMEIPSPFAGKVVEIAVKEGDPVQEESLLVVLESPSIEPRVPTPPVAPCRIPNRFRHPQWLRHRSCRNPATPRPCPAPRSTRVQRCAGWPANSASTSAPSTVRGHAAGSSRTTSSRS